MSRTLVFKVVRNRMQFKCPHCGVRRSLSVPPSVRRKSLRCHKCGETVRCSLNRRAYPRESLSGKMMMIMPEGEELEVYLTDMSPNGAGFDLSISAIRRNKIAVGKEVRFSCSWGKHLLGSGTWVIVNFKGQHIGVKKYQKYIV